MHEPAQLMQGGEPVVVPGQWWRKHQEQSFPDPAVIHNSPSAC